MASLLTAEFVAANHLPADSDGQKQMLADWHRRKTAIYKEMVRAGQLPARSGIARIVDEALAANTSKRLALASPTAREVPLRARRRRRRRRLRQSRARRQRHCSTPSPRQSMSSSGRWPRFGGGDQTP